MIQYATYFFGDYPEAIYNTNVYFDNTYKDNWITKSISKEIIKDVDKSEVLDEINDFKSYFWKYES